MTTQSDKAIMQALETYGSRIDKIASVAERALETSQSSAVTIAELKATIKALKESLDKVIEAVNASNKLEGRVVALETEYTNMVRELEETKSDCRKRWKFVNWAMASIGIATIVFWIRTIFIHLTRGDPPTP